MMTDEHLEARIAEDERWLAALPTPQPSAELIEQVKLAVQVESAKLALEADDGPEPGTVVLARVKSAVRAEARRLQSARLRWARWVPLAAAAVLALAVLWPDRTMPQGPVEPQAEAERAVDEFILALADAIDPEMPAAAGDSPVDWEGQADVAATADSELAFESLFWEVQAFLAEDSDEQPAAG